MPKRCGGWASSEALATNPYCQCGTPYIISRKTIKSWEGEGSFGDTMAACIAKGIGRSHESKCKKKWLHLGFGGSPEGRRGSWIAGAPRLTYFQVCAMGVAAAKEPDYSSVMEDPHHLQWGEGGGAHHCPKGDQGQPLFNHIYTDHVCPPKPPPTWGVEG
eukprot:1081776-Karenia_brevis.AAC.1